MDELESIKLDTMKRLYQDFSRSKFENPLSLSIVLKEKNYSDIAGLTVWSGSRIFLFAGKLRVISRMAAGLDEFCPDGTFASCPKLLSNLDFANAECVR